MSLCTSDTKIFFFDDSTTFLRSWKSLKGKGTTLTVSNTNYEKLQLNTQKTRSSRACNDKVFFPLFLFSDTRQKVGKKVYHWLPREALIECKWYRFPYLKRYISIYACLMYREKGSRSGHSTVNTYGKQGEHEWREKI